MLPRPVSISGRGDRDVMSPLTRGRGFKQMSLESIQQIILEAPGFLLGITLHEYAHGYVAMRFGDPTAKLAGRLTLNPISHIDPFGALALVLAGIGWAKPVPVDPRYLHNPRKDMIWVSLAGPAVNMITAIAMWLILCVINFSVGLESIAAGSMFHTAVQMFFFAVLLNLMLAFLNLVPIHPLDGSKILEGLLPRDLAYEYEKMEPYGMIILIGLLFIGPQIGFDFFGLVVMGPTRFVFGLLLSIMGIHVV